MYFRGGHLAKTMVECYHKGEHFEGNSEQNHCQSGPSRVLSLAVS